MAESMNEKEDIEGCLKAIHDCINVTDEVFNKISDKISDPRVLTDLLKITRTLIAIRYRLEKIASNKRDEEKPNCIVLVYYEQK